MVVASDWPAWVDLLFKGLAGIGGVAGMVGGLAMALARRTFATKNEVRRSFEKHDVIHEELERQLADGAKEFAAIKANLTHLPSQDDIADVKERIAAVEGSVRALGATIDGVREILERVERPLNILIEHHMKASS